MGDWRRPGKQHREAAIVEDCKDWWRQQHRESAAVGDWWRKQQREAAIVEDWYRWRKQQ